MAHDRVNDSDDPTRLGERPRVTEELAAVDVSLLDRLQELRRNQLRIQEYRQKAEALKDQVPQPVWRRVVDDYTARDAEGGRLSAPLRAKALMEERKLGALSARVTAILEQARLTVQELEFRHAVGELDQEALEAGLKGPHAILSQCESDLEAIAACQARFDAALGKERDRDAAPVDIHAEVETALQPIDELAAPVPKGATTGHRQGDAELSANGDEAKTMRLPAAAVFVGTADAQPAEHRLAALNYLGRAEENQIRVTQPGVSRRHALILVTPKGYTIRDLGSQNGTFVNGSRITESALADGDTIDIGSARIIFRSPWPGASAER
jgi:hypothetical protein